MKYEDARENGKRGIRFPRPPCPEKIALGGSLTVLALYVTASIAFRSASAAEDEHSRRLGGVWQELRRPHSEWSAPPFDALSLDPWTRISPSQPGPEWAASVRTRLVEEDRTLRMEFPDWKPPGDELCEDHRGS